MVNYELWMMNKTQWPRFILRRGGIMAKFRITAKHVEVSNLMEERDYVRKELVPPLEKRLDRLKETEWNAPRWKLEERQRVEKQILENQMRITSIDRKIRDL